MLDSGIVAQVIVLSVAVLAGISISPSHSGPWKKPISFLSQVYFSSGVHDISPYVLHLYCIVQYGNGIRLNRDLAVFFFSLSPPPPLPFAKAGWEIGMSGWAFAMISCILQSREFLFHLFFFLFFPLLSGWCSTTWLFGIVCISVMVRYDIRGGTNLKWRW